MKEVEIAKNCGLCAGCKHAIDTALNATKKYKNVTILKEIVHNPSVNTFLKQNDIGMVQDITQLNSNNTVILRAHGEPLSTYSYLRNNNIHYIDCTCHNVSQIHNQVLKFSSFGYNIILIGKHGNNNQPMHPEVEGTIGWSMSPVLVIEDFSDIALIEQSQAKNFYLACQTTFNKELAEQLIEKIQSICTQKQCELIVDKTICPLQNNIQECSKKLARTCDIMIVVGGKNSSNTQELYNSLKNITNTIFLQDISKWQEEFEKRLIVLNPDLKIGITAGASTLKQELETLKANIEQQLKINEKRFNYGNIKI